MVRPPRRRPATGPAAINTPRAVARPSPFGPSLRRARARRRRSQARHAQAIRPLTSRTTREDTPKVTATAVINGTRARNIPNQGLDDAPEMILLHILHTI